MLNIFKGEKVQQSCGYRSSATGSDISGCTPMGGILKKKNSHGIWQKRYFCLNNDYFVYKKDENHAVVRGAFDLLELEGNFFLREGGICSKTICDMMYIFPLITSSKILSKIQVHTYILALIHLLSFICI